MRRAAVGAMTVAMLSTAATIALLPALISDAVAAPDFASVQVQPYEPPRSAPALKLPDLNGRTVTLAELKGKVVMLFFWATW